jgi:hypothetical protein
MRIEQSEITTFILKPITRADIDELERILQADMPPGWTITCLVALHGEHHDLVGYELQAGFETIRIGTEGQAEPPDGWEIKRIGGAFYNEISITAPGGPSVLIYDTPLA